MNVIGPLAAAVPLIDKKVTQSTYKGDFADRLNSRITVIILAVSCAFLGTGHIWGKPINCWTPAQFTSRWNEFIDQYCYVHGTYFSSLDDALTHNTEERTKQEINYYQWVPYILGLQAFLFYVPRFLRKSLASRFGYDLAGAIRYLDEFWANVRAKPEQFKNRLTVFENGPAVYVWEGLRLASRKSSVNLSTCYAAAAVLQMINSWLQWYWLNNLLQPTGYVLWGPNVLFDLIRGYDWQTTGHFPRIVHCDFQRRSFASVQLDTVLCVLHLNIYYEKICLFLWFWMLFVALVSTSSAITWVMTIFYDTSRSKVRMLLSCTPEAKKTPSEYLFFEALGNDGLFVLQHVAINLGDMPASYLAAAMRNCCKNYLEDGMGDPIMVTTASEPALIKTPTEERPLMLNGTTPQISTDYESTEEEPLIMIASPDGISKTPLGEAKVVNQ